jgi:hypothetical protein
MFAFVAPFVFVVIVRSWRDLGWSLALLFLPFGLYVAFNLLTAPQAFRFDIAFTLSRLNQVSLSEQVANLALNYTTLISQDFWMLAGIIGLFLLRPARLMSISLLIFWLPLLVIGRNFALHSLSAYYMIPLLPVVALGVASLVRYGLPFIRDAVYENLGKALPPTTPYTHRLRSVIAYVIIALLIATPLLTSLALTINNVQTHYLTAIDPFLVNPDDARRVAAYINAHVDRDDVVIASPTIGWLFEVKVADFQMAQMAVAVTGEDTPHLPGNLPLERYAFDPHYQQARYVVVDNLWRNWGAVHIPGVVKMLADVESWSLLFESGAIQVYANPAWTD